MKIPKSNMKGRNHGILSEDRVYTNQILSHAIGSANLVLYLLDTIDQFIDVSHILDANLERSYGNYFNDRELQGQS